MFIGVRNIQTGKFRECGSVAPGTFQIPEGYEEVRVDSFPATEEREIDPPVSEIIQVFSALSAEDREAVGKILIRADVDDNLKNAKGDLLDSLSEKGTMGVPTGREI